MFYATALNPKLRTYLGRTKMASGGIDPRRHRFGLSNELSKVYAKKPTGNNIICRLYQAGHHLRQYVTVIPLLSRVGDFLSGFIT